MNTVVIINKLCGVVSVLGGIYGLIFVYYIIPRHIKNPEQLELWQRRFGKTIKICSPIIIIGGILLILGILG
jgi:hypothetical protein